LSFSGAVSPVTSFSVTKHVNQSSCTVKQISVRYIHTLTVAVLYCCCTVNYINKFYYNFAPEGRKVTWLAAWPTVLLSQFLYTDSHCTPSLYHSLHSWSCHIVLINAELVEIGLSL